MSEKRKIIIDLHKGEAITHELIENAIGPMDMQTEDMGEPDEVEEIELVFREV